jgi:hypothetical protein
MDQRSYKNLLEVFWGVEYGVDMELLDNALRMAGVILLILGLVLSYVAPAVGIVRWKMGLVDKDDPDPPRGGWC